MRRAQQHPMRAYEAVLFDLYGTLVDDTGDAAEGALALVESASSGAWGVVTSCPARLARALLVRGGFPEPPLVIAAEDVARSKPSPECYRLAAARLGVSAESCLAFEDSTHGVAAARAAGMDVVDVREAALGGLSLRVDPVSKRLTLETGKLG